MKLLRQHLHYYQFHHLFLNHVPGREHSLSSKGAFEGMTEVSKSNWRGNHAASTIPPKSSLIVLFLFVVCVTVLRGQDTAGVGAITGIVTNHDSSPAVAVRVCALTTTRCVETDQSGAFRLTEIRVGEYQLEVSAPDRLPDPSTSVAVRAGLENHIRITLPATDVVKASITVSEPVFVAPEEIKTSSFLVERQEVFKSSVAQMDVSRYIQSLPGVGVGRSAMRNDLIVRGGSQLENLFVVDNIEIPNINTFANFASAGGLTSVLDADLIRDVNFMTGGYPAPFINRTSSVLQIAAREGNRDQFSARLSMSILTGGVILEGPLGRRKKGSWVTSVKRSFLEAIPAVFDSSPPIIYTFNTKALYDLTPQDRIWAVNFSSLDSVRLKPNLDSKETESQGVDLNYKGRRFATGINWQHLFGESGVGLFGFSHSEAHVNQTMKDVLRYGLPVETTPIMYREKSSEGESTLKYDLTIASGGFGKIQVGGSFKTFRNHYNTAAPHGVDNPFSPDRDVNPFILLKNRTSYQSGAYFQSTRNLTSRLNLTWGGRFDNYQMLGRTRFSPRIGISYKVNDKLSIRSSYGHYYQQPLYLLLETFPQNRTLTPIRSTHMVVGLTYVLGPTVRMTVEAYQKDYKDYPVSLQFPSFSLASAGDTFDVTEILMPYTSAGRGRARGLEFFIEKKFRDRWFAQANLSISSTKFSGLDGIRRPGTYDYPVVLNFVMGYKLTKKWDVSTSFRAMSGRPYTPFNEALSTEQNREIYDLNRINGLRAPAYFRPDIRLDRTFTVHEKPLLFWVGVQNIFNRRYVTGVEWNQNTNRPQAARQEGVFPLIGIDWKF